MNNQRRARTHTQTYNIHTVGKINGWRIHSIRRKIIRSLSSVFFFFYFPLHSSNFIFPPSRELYSNNSHNDCIGKRDKAHTSIYIANIDFIITAYSAAIYIYIYRAFIRAFETQQVPLTHLMRYVTTHSCVCVCMHWEYQIFNLRGLSHRKQFCASQQKS